MEVVVKNGNSPTWVKIGKGNVGFAKTPL